VKPPDAQSTPLTHGDMLTAISDGLVALLKEFYGRGPTRAKSYYEDDLSCACCAEDSPEWSRPCSKAVAAPRSSNSEWSFKS
jgi:hypothetical protein